MGTRADFYVGRGESAEWIGSITWDGYPSGIDTDVLKAETEEDYRTQVAAFFANRDDVTRPTEFWPWPWDDSRTTDYAYAFEGGKVYASSFGHSWFGVDPGAECFGEPEESPKDAVFPDMSGRRGSHDEVMSRSGLIVVSVPTAQEGPAA